MKPKRTSRPAAKPASSASNPKSELLNSQSETILLAVTGMSPGILTETVWALAHEAEPVVPARLIALTTVEGRRRIAEQLFAPCPRFGGQSPWDTLRATLATAGHDLTGRLRFGATADDIRIITAPDPATGRSRELVDIRTPADNEAAADFLLEQVRAIVENPDTRLIASLAGGRKTMGALLYACLTLVGRETDRLTHVLVNEPFETLPDFWFPGQPGGPIANPALRKPTCKVRHAKSGTANLKSEMTFDPAAARVDLADVPFVPLRNLFQRELGRKAGTFSRLVGTCRDSVRQRAVENLRVSLDTARPELEVNGATIKLAPREHLLLLFLARRAKNGEPPYAAYKEAEDDVNAFRSQVVAAAPASNFADWRHTDSLRAAWCELEIRKLVSGIREKLRQHGGEATTLAHCLPEKGRCSLDLPGPLINIKD